MRKKLILISILMFGFVASASAQTATFSNFQPADGSNFNQGSTITLSVDATVQNNGTSVDIEGIFDGNIDQVFTHPGDGSTQSYSFQVTPSEGSYNYRFSAITSSPSGTFINDTESRTLNVQSTTGYIDIDDFEDNNMDEYSGSPTQIENGYVGEGNYAGLLPDQGTGNTMVAERNISTMSPDRISYLTDIDSNDAGGCNANLRFLDGDNQVINSVLFPSCDTSNAALNGNSYTVSSLNIGTDYEKVEIVFDWANNEVDEWYVNGNLIAQNVAFANPADSIDKMALVGYQESVYYDNITRSSAVQINSFTPPDESNITEGESQVIEANITVDNQGTPVDIEGIFDGNIDTVFSHPGDGSSKVVNFTVTPSSPGDYNYWFNVITSSPSGTSLGSTEVRNLNVDEQTTTATFSNFSPADNTTVYTGNSQDISVDATVQNNGTSVDIEAIYNGSIDQVFTHPGDGSTQSYNFTVTPSTEGTPDYRFSAITSSPGGTFINDTESRNLFVTDYPATANFTNFSPPDGSNITEGESQTISIDISVDNNGNPVDVEGIFDGSIQSVGSHPGDGTTQSYSFTVTPSSAGNFTYRFSVITDSPSGTFIDDSGIRTLEVLSSDTDGGTDGGTGDNIGGMIGGTIAEILAGIVDGFFSGIESQVSESNQAFLAIIVSVILGMIAGAFTGHGSFGVGTTVLSVLGFTIKGWLPSWVGFVFVVITAGLVAWIGSKAGGG